MAGTPLEWNVVIVGAWNVAILTPAGVASRLFQLQSGTPIDVQVPIDRRAPVLVQHGGISVAPSENLLLVAPIVPAVGGLKGAADVASRALVTLPETPVTAAGVNLRFGFDSLPDSLLAAVISSLDDALAEADLRVRDKSLKRSVEWRQGLLNLEIMEDAQGGGTIALNFHREASSSNELRDWLALTPEMVDFALRLLDSTFKVTIEGING